MRLLVASVIALASVGRASPVDADVTFNRDIAPIVFARPMVLLLL